jgi:hypothetical protein
MTFFIGVITGEHAKAATGKEKGVKMKSHRQSDGGFFR